MLVEILYLILGFIFLISGANVLVKGSSNIAKQLNVPEILIGLTIVALGTSMPELIVTITSASKGAGELIVGNAIGSNLCNLLLILGLIAIIKPIKIDKETRNIHIPVSLFATIIVLFMGYRSEIIRTDGIMLLILFIIYFSYPIIKQIKKTKNNVKRVGERVHPYTKKIQNKKIISIIYILLGIILLKYGGDFVVDNSINIAKKLKISQEIIGLTVIALGTSLPELVTSIVATIKDDQDLAIGNIIGSCIFNLILILGIGAIITPLKISSEFLVNLNILITSTILIWVYNFIGQKNYITLLKGGILVTIFTIYMINLFI